MQPQCCLLLSAITILMVCGQEEKPYGCPTTSPPTPPTFSCPSNATTPTTTATTSTTTATTSTTTTATPTTTTNCPTTTAFTPTTTTPSPDSCRFPPQCNVTEVINIVDIGPELTPLYEQVTSPGDSDVDGTCSTLFYLGNNTYNFVRCSRKSNGDTVIMRFVYAQIDGNAGLYRGQGLTGPNGCDTCVFNDYYIGQPCSDLYVISRCHLFGNGVEEYGGSQYVAFSTSEFVSNECYGPLEQMIGSDYRTLPRHLETVCVTRIGEAVAINADRVPLAQRLELTE